MTLKKVICCILLLALLLELPLGSLQAHAEEETLVVLDAAADEPENYKKITGFEITYRLVKGGHMGSAEDPFPVNGLMAAAGVQTEDAFGWDSEGSFPKFIGPAEEIATHVTGDGSFVGTMIFKNGLDAGALAEGETAVFRYEGTSALFDDSNSCITLYPLFETQVEVQGVTWIQGEIKDSGEKFTWESVETQKFMDVPTVENPKDGNYVNITVPVGEGPYPVILWIHGGGWTQLDRNSCIISDTVDYLLSKGFAVVSAEYTKSELKDDVIATSGYPDMIYDLKAAVRFLRANAEEYRLDTDFIAAMGESAGAHLAMLLGTTNGKAEYEDLSMGNAEYPSDVQAMVSYFGPTDLFGDPIMAYAVFGEGFTEEQAKTASPYYQIDENAPPLFLTHGKNDATVSVTHSEKMEERAKELLGEKNVTAVYYENAPHANIAAFDSGTAMQAVERFLSAKLIQARHQKKTSDKETGQVQNGEGKDTNPEVTQQPTGESDKKTEAAAQPEAKEGFGNAGVIAVAVVAVIAVAAVLAFVFLRRRKKNKK